MPDQRQQQAAVADPRGNYGKDPEALTETLRSSKMTSELFDPPLSPMLLREPLPRYWMVRFYLALRMIVTSLVIYLEPQSLVHQVLNGDAAGWFCLLILFVLGGIALVDVGINDLLPRRYKFRWAHERRHWVYTLMALAMFALTFVIVRETGTLRPMLVSFWADALIAGALAPIDLFVRHRGREL